MLIRIGVILVILSTAGCDGSQQVDLCTKYSYLYPDIISGREETERNQQLISGMRAYNEKDYSTAVAHFNNHLARFPKDASAYLYKAVSQLHMAEPFEAELTLDHLERLPDPAYTDQVDYYNMLCLLCSDQLPRAREQAERILKRRIHTYSDQASALIADLQER